jgi:hypothetical protein
VRDDLAPGAKPQAIIPRNFVEAQQMCQALAGSGLVPKAFRTATGALDMLIVVMTGSELGIPPMAALRLFTTWDGVPRLMSEGVRAVILMNPDIEYFEVSTCDETQATWVGKRRGRPEKTAKWTIERARKAELLGKENWRKYPEDMLNARASMQLGRMLAPDIISGMRSLEEAQDGDFVEVTAIEKPAFVAPPPNSLTTTNTITHVTDPATRQGPPPGVPAIDAPRRGRPPKDKPVEVAATERPTSSGGASASAPATSGGSATPSTGSTATGVAPEPSAKLDAAIQAVREQDAGRVPASVTTRDVWGQPVAADPTPPASTSAPSPSTASDAGSSAVNGAAGAPADDNFGEDPVDTKSAAGDLVGPGGGPWRAEFVAAIDLAKSQRELATLTEGWRAWSAGRRNSGDATFGAGGENSGWMARTYATRKAELPV